MPFDHDISNCFNTFMNPGSGASETGTGEVQGEVEMFRIINFKMKKGFTNSTSVRITKTKFHFTSSHFLESASHLLFVFLIFFHPSASSPSYQISVGREGKGLEASSRSALASGVPSWNLQQWTHHKGIRK